MGQRRPTLRDVADAAGVHFSLVSRVLRDDPRGFASKDTRARILRAADEVGYRADASARGLRSSRTMTLGLLLPGFSSPVYSSIAQGVEEQAKQHGYGLVLGTHAAGDPHETITDMVMHGRVDAMLVASGQIEDAALRRLAGQLPRSVVLVNRQVRGVSASVVLRDGDATACAVEHLAALGHRSICGIFGPRTLDTMVRRERGFVRAAQRLDVRATTVEMPDRDYAAGYEGALRVLRSTQRPTALVAGTFPMGVGALAAARSENIAVPGEISVLSVHNDQLADYLTPRLTTVSMPTKRLGAEAVELALVLTAGGAARRVVVPDPPELIARDSTAGPARI
ncbi:LacI family DNA-binding transcriptional regulator [Amycolatopsis sp. GM8]|uniref:LacI family DNA-binding transcriptional regulator n=1 Tax=Amycolatopsis sp. GM8 TaxID=2896530 RepID=UPI001F438D7B|nr:LacI family DNA-binding transcriptional regulator [Amycolatopsis sp. GM8]